MEINFKGRAIPRDSNNNPAFKVLMTVRDIETLKWNQTEPPSTSILSVFTPQEIVEMVNFAIDNLE